MRAVHSASVLSINLEAILKNYQLLKNKVNGAECGAVLKADAYGIGAKQVGTVLKKAGCKTFFVATLDEGVDLRGYVGPDPWILVLNGLLDSEVGVFVEYKLTPVLNTQEQIQIWSKFSLKIHQTLFAAVHLDTGMSRLGLSEAEARTLAESKCLLDGIKIVLFMSHLVSAEKSGDPLNDRQLQIFNSLLKQQGIFPTSIANSSGIFLGPEFHLDLVRPGAALYGVNPQREYQNPMNEVVQLKTKIIQIRRVDSPQTVGYGATHRVTGPTTIATVPVGYADGYFRSLSGASHCYVSGIKVPVVGRVSMDLITLDVSAVPERSLFSGAEAILIGGDLTIDWLADKAGTIAYELLTALGVRYHREYNQGVRRL